ncbi:hypothetical protein B7463_g8978, partial [Scytalidium lignicola]
MANVEDNPELPQNREAYTLLKTIVDELRSIRLAQTRQDERIDALLRDKISQFPSNNESLLVHETEPSPSAVSAKLSQNSTIPIEKRTGPILSEALRRYSLDVVPSWSCLYGTHSMPSSQSQTSEELTRNAEWTSTVRELWKIPHDNRIGFCFRSPACEPIDVDRVRNFVSHLHILKSSNDPKGQYFNVWDWFDTGLSAYWYPGIAVSEQQIYGSLLKSSDRPSEIQSAEANSYRLSPMIAPWRRMINMQGLTSLSMRDCPLDTEELMDLDLCPFIAETRDSVFPEPMNEVLWRAIRCHLRCQRAPETEPMETKGTLIFHITFYEILKSRLHSEMLELWPCGDLHSDYLEARRPRKLRESALTIVAIPSAGLPGTKLRSIFWTMLCMRPNQFPHLYYFERRDDLMKGYTHEMIDEIGDIVHGSLLAVIDRWEEIAHHFDGLLAEKNALLNPGYHDSLLNDDNTFTRSKKYFWAIEFLKEVESSISDNLKQAQKFIDLMVANPPATVAARNMFATRVNKHQVAIKKLETLKISFRRKQDEAKALRDGCKRSYGKPCVYTARREYKAPYSFWSMSNALFSLTSLAIVMPIITFSTYTIVLNLNNIIQFYHSIQRSLAKLSPFSTFISHQNRSRKERGNAFTRLGPSNQGPSCWQVVQYFLQKGIVSTLAGFSSLIASAVQAGKRRRRGRTETSDEKVLPTRMANLGDVCVQFEVTMDIEDVGKSPELDSSKRAS